MHNEYGLQMGNDDDLQFESPRKTRKKRIIRDELRIVRGRLRKALKKIREMEENKFYERIAKRRV